MLVSAFIMYRWNYHSETKFETYPHVSTTVFSDGSGLSSQNTPLPPVIITHWMTPRSRWGRKSGSRIRSEKPSTYTSDPLPSTETEARKSPPFFSHSCHVTLRSCDKPLPSLKTVWHSWNVWVCFKFSFWVIHSSVHYIISGSHLPPQKG